MDNINLSRQQRTDISKYQFNKRLAEETHPVKLGTYLKDEGLIVWSDGTSEPWTPLPSKPYTYYRNKRVI